MVTYLFPGLYFIILGIPTFLIYDFGIYFLAYLRGVGSSPIFIFELLYDYIAVIIFYTRILVQGVRLILMLGAYISMHDLIMFFVFGEKILFSSDYLFEEVDVLNESNRGLTYFLLIGLPCQLIY